MPAFDHSKYLPFPPVRLRDRNWPDRVITQAPIWCSVDLRDGNQALIEPMTVAQKLQMFELLLKVGFKQIEVGFPAASAPDFDFVRKLIEDRLIPEDVTIQVLTQAREELIDKTFQALQGAKRAIVHLYNSTSKVQREQVFNLDREGIVAIAVRGAQRIQANAAARPETDWHFQYSPESFTGTELDFAVQVCDAVTEVWQPSAHKPVIINLPATVEMSTPNIYADQIEWFCRQVARREALIISLHTHNDRGCAVAAAELGVMAGADRIEGTLLGNGERTGNMDIVTMAMNLYSQGVDPRLQLDNMDEIIQTVTACTQLPVHPRHPYAGELVFTAFSGSHQDAINKCLRRYRPGDPWQVAYLPIDPRDLGRSYQQVVRINSQSGKGGVAYVLERDYGLQLPRWLQIDFSAQVQQAAEQQGGELASEAIYALFQRCYMNAETPYRLTQYQLSRQQSHDRVKAVLAAADAESVTTTDRIIEGEGAGAMGAFASALERALGCSIAIVDYAEHTLGGSSDANAVAYVQAGINGERHLGVAVSRDIVEASMAAVLHALNKSLAARAEAAA